MEEKNKLLSKLHEIGKDWDAEKKEIVDHNKFVPSEGENFWFIGVFGEIVKTNEWINDISSQLIDAGNCFPTEEAAKTYAEKIKQLLKTRE